MREAAANTLLNQYLREKRMYCYYELKVAKNGRVAFSSIETNQDEGLPALARQGLVWKLSDEDSRKKPCDGFCAPPLPAFLVIRFRDEFVFVHYEDIQTMRESGLKSITHEEAKKLSPHTLRVRH